MARKIRLVPCDTGNSVSAAKVSAPSCVPVLPSATSWAITASILSRRRLFAHGDRRETAGVAMHGLSVVLGEMGGEHALLDFV
jgi:hypothetical protein